MSARTEKLELDKLAHRLATVAAESLITSYGVPMDSKTNPWYLMQDGYPNAPEAEQIECARSYLTQLGRLELHPTDSRLVRLKGARAR